MKRKSKSAFTLVELIIVVVIIAILATIAFLTLWDYPMQARDARRLSDKNNIEKALEIYRAQKGSYPKFDEENWQKIFWTWAWEKVNTSLSTLPRDPLTNKLYKIEIKETPDKVKIAKVVLEWESWFTNWSLANNATASWKSEENKEKSNQLKTDPKAPDYIIPMENWKCKEWYLPYEWNTCRKIWKIEIVYWNDIYYSRIKIPFGIERYAFKSIDCWKWWVLDYENIDDIRWKYQKYKLELYCKYNIKQDEYKITYIGYSDYISNNIYSEATNRNIIKITDWNELGVEYLFGAFFFARNFNQDISMFDTSRILDMGYMFLGAEKFNQPLNNWDISNVTNMGAMFERAESFNQPLNNWSTLNVNYMGSMFDWASSFNQDISNWNVSNVKNMNSMFNGATSFNQPIWNWDVSKVTNWGSFSYNSWLTKEKIPVKFR